MPVEWLIRKLKRNPDYKWESSYGLKDLLIVLYVRGIQVARGLLQRVFFGQSSGFLFIGSRVKLIHSHHLRVGRNFIVGDNSCINALSQNGVEIGNNVSLGRSVTIICTGVISQIGVGVIIRDGVGVNDGAYLGGQGGIEIGSNVIIGPGVKIFSENHNFEDTSTPIKDQGVSRKGVMIGNDCWLGANSIILDGVNLGSGCVVAAGAIVTKSFPSNCVVGGVPAKILKQRQ